MADTLASDSPPPSEPTSFGPYRLLRKLGRGGMAEAYLAERTGPADFRRRVCLKLILPDSAQDKDFINWFFDEARIHAQLHHEHIVQVYEFGEHDGRNYLALEFVEGCDLYSLMEALSGRGLLLPPALVVHVAYALAGALECAHQLSIDGVPQNLVHRDLTPSNVLLSLQGHAKLSDFGVVKAQTRSTRTEVGIAKGKVPYMSPEQMVGTNIDGRTDLFALGVIMFELFSGRHPYRHYPTDPDIILARRIYEGERPPLKSVAPHVPDALCSIVDSLLEPDADKRPASATVLLDLLEPHVPGAAAAREFGHYVEAACGKREFPASAVVHTLAPPLDGDGPAVSHSVVVRKAPPGGDAEPAPSASKVPSWVRWAAAPAGLALVALVVVLLRASSTPAPPPPAPPPAVPTALPTEPPPAVQAHANAVPPASAASATLATAEAPPSEPAPAPAAPEAPAPTDPAATPPRPDAANAQAESAGGASEKRASRAKAHLRVVVLPFGKVEVDGQLKNAPYEFELSPGSHTIRAGRTSELSNRTTVRLKPGERREVIVDLQPGQ